MKNSFIRGISLIEVLGVIAILALMIGIVVPALSNFRDQQTLNNTSDDIVSLLNQARTQTLSSYNSTYYSVHFTTTSATLFTGGTYNNGTSTNKVVTYSSLVASPASGGINLNGGGSDVSFTRLTGDATGYGTIVIQIVANSAKQKTVTINQTGTISAN